ncbi:hypothetical protein KY284_020145 [Solanum tuberosum]|nr:hypothetical protein KY284_020145 [Solanum tuberosum]
MSHLKITHLRVLEHRQIERFSKTLLPKSDEGGIPSGSSENMGSESDDGSGNQSTDNSRGSVESERNSKGDANTYPPVVEPEAETKAQIEEDHEVTPDDTMVQYVHAREPNPGGVTQQLIDCFRVMWTVNRSKEFFNKGIVSKSGGFRDKPLMPETRVVMADIQAFLEIYRLFQIHQFEWMNITPREYTGHLPKKFYSIYATTLMNMGNVVDISEASISRMLHGPKYTTPISIGLFKAKHHAVTSESEMEDPTSREHVMYWIAGYIAKEG